MEFDILRHENVKVARRYFWCGFLGLPFLWIVNYFYFRNVISEAQVNRTVYAYVMLSKWCGIVSVLLLVLWMVSFWIVNDESWPDAWYINTRKSQTF